MLSLFVRAAAASEVPASAYEAPLGDDSSTTAVQAAKEAVDVGAQAAATQLHIMTEFFTPERLMAYIIGGIRFLVMVLFLFVTWRILRYLLRRVMRRQRAKAGAGARTQLYTAGHLLESVLGYVMVAFGIIGFLSIIGFDMRGLVASAGVAGVLIAFISQSVIKDWVSGLFILIERQHEVGDWVKIGHYEGEVKTVGMRTTVLHTYDNEVVFIPNGAISEVINYSKLPARGTIDLGLDYEADPKLVAAVFERTLAAFNRDHAAQLAEPAQVLGVVDLADSAVIWRLTYTAHDRAHFALSRKLRESLWQAFRAADIAIPYPQIELSMKEVEAHAPGSADR